MSSFVSVGNATQPFDRLLQAVRSCLTELPQPVFVQYGSGQDIFAGACATAAFVTMDEFARRVFEAKLLILHAGAGSLINAAKAGKVPVVMPRRQQYGEHVDDHQVEFTCELARAGKIVVCEGVAGMSAAVRQAARLQNELSGRAAESRMVRLVREVLAQY